MNKCPNCGTEFEGNFCPNCGTALAQNVCPKCRTPLSEGAKFCANCGHSLEKKPKPEWLTKAIAFCKTNWKKIAITATVLIAFALIVAIPLALELNIFRVGKVSKINIGDDQATVEKLLGKPTDKSDGSWHYLQKKAAKVYRKMNAIGEDEEDFGDFFDDLEKYDKLYTKLEKMTYSYIKVSFDGNGKVTEVFLDRKHHFDENDDYAGEKKYVKEVKTNPKEIETTVNGDGKPVLATKSVDWVYTVKYSDKSFYRKAMGYVTTEFSDDAKSCTLKWKDSLGEYQTTLSTRYIDPKVLDPDFEYNVYSITYNLNGGTNAAGNPTSYTILTAKDGIALADPTKVTSSVLLEYERLENGNYSVTRETTAYTFLGWYTESTFENQVTNVTYTGAAVQLYAKWSENTTTTTTTTTESVYLRDGDYIYFGEYPQTVKANGVAITATQDARGYYLGSDGAYYANVTATPVGSGYTFSTGATVTSGKVYYFKVEPIRWRILSETDGVALILCDSIIDNHVYYRNSSNRTINGQTVYPNNYKESDIRAWLNGQFYETAFSELQRELILTTTVDNSARSTNPNNNATQWNSGTNTYACANTQDKIFLLSEQEVTNSAYGFNASYSNYDTARRKVTSDYSRATGAYMNTSAGDYFGGNGWWWLRSPYYNGSAIARDVNDYGSADDDGDVDFTYGGVVPALQIRF